MDSRDSRDRDTLRINLKNLAVNNQKPNKACSLEDYIEVDKRYLYFFKNTWIKYTDTTDTNQITYSGGFLIEETPDYISLRNVKGVVIDVEKKGYIFYCKKNSEQYKALQEIQMEREKLNIERQNFIKEKNIFLREKKEFLKKYLKIE